MGDGPNLFTDRSIQVQKFYSTSLRRTQPDCANMALLKALKPQCGPDYHLGIPACLKQEEKQRLNLVSLFDLI